MKKDPQVIAKEEVYDYVLDHLDKSDDTTNFLMEHVYVVWFCYTLGNWKALLSTTLLDGMYYEVTYNVAEGDLYLDVYKKFEHRWIHIG